MKIRLEIRPGEGGADAQDLVGVQSGIYAAYAARKGLGCTVEPAGAS